jgi:hypothetical protein
MESVVAMSVNSTYTSIQKVYHCEQSQEYPKLYIPVMWFPPALLGYSEMLGSNVDLKGWLSALIMFLGFFNPSKKTQTRYSTPQFTDCSFIECCIV